MSTSTLMASSEIGNKFAPARQIGSACPRDVALYIPRIVEWEDLRKVLVNVVLTQRPPNWWSAARVHRHLVSRIIVRFRCVCPRQAKEQSAASRPPAGLSPVARASTRSSHRSWTCMAKSSPPGIMVSSLESALMMFSAEWKLTCTGCPGGNSGSGQEPPKLVLVFFDLGLTGDVDTPPHQLRGEPYVLTSAANRQRKLVVGHDELDGLVFLVDHTTDIGRRSGIANKLRDVFAERDNIYFSPRSSCTTA